MMHRLGLTMLLKSPISIKCVHIGRIVWGGYIRRICTRRGNCWGSEVAYGIEFKRTPLWRRIDEFSFLSFQRCSSSTSSLPNLLLLLMFEQAAKRFPCFGWHFMTAWIDSPPKPRGCPLNTNWRVMRRSEAIKENNAWNWKKGIVIEFLIIFTLTQSNGNSTNYLKMC